MSQRQSFLLRRLLTALLSPKQTKQISIDEYFRVPKPWRALEAVTRHLVLRFQTSAINGAVENPPSPSGQLGPRNTGSTRGSGTPGNHQPPKGLIKANGDWFQSVCCIRENNISTLALQNIQKIMQENSTIIAEFFLLGFQHLNDLKTVFFSFLLLIHCVTLSGNIFIPSIVLSSRNLHTPMYFFLSQLASAEMLFTTNIIPKLLYIILAEGATVSVIGCVTQFYIFSVSTNAESFFLTLMSYDRYLAICNPLQYNNIMVFSHCVWLATVAWVFSFTSTLIVIIQLCMLQFCGSNVIDHYYCDLSPLLEHACSDIFFLKLQIFMFSVPIALLPFVFILITYIRIVFTILKIPSTTGKKKAFSTCSSHLIVVCTYYTTLITIYIFPSSGDSSNLNKSLSLLYTVVTPLFNPIIYSLRNRDIREVLEKIILKKLKHT
ncbi:olfactory receptor 1J4-like [Pelobates fuscus]|uniref:olfactory receptor 1J4-like n=1 Tax=Pelobates fuscus TaxID=191477 RepID=UPI002FE446BB